MEEDRGSGGQDTSDEKVQNMYLHKYKYGSSANHYTYNFFVMLNQHVKGSL